MRPQGELVAVLAGATAFALIHLPRYGAAALPLDLGVGVLLGGLRLLSGGRARRRPRMPSLTWPAG